MSDAVKDKRKGYCCDQCGQFVKLYSRSFNSNMGIALIVLYKYGSNKFAHLEDLLSKHGYKRCGDASYLVHYGLIERFEGKRSDGSKRNGHYRITGRGIMFAESKLTVHEKFLIYNNTCEGFEGSQVSIAEVLGEKFDYDKLMGNFKDEVLVRQHTRTIKKEDNNKSNWLFGDIT